MNKIMVIINPTSGCEKALDYKVKLKNKARDYLEDVEIKITEKAMEYWIDIRYILFYFVH